MTLRLLIFLFCATVAQAAGFKGKVVGVTDGDTITVVVEHRTQKESVRVRLWGIDAPEVKQPFGRQAKEALAAYVLDKMVEVWVMDFEGERLAVGRAFISSGGVRESINEEMVRRGHAWHDRKFTNTGKSADNLEKAEAEARAAKRGLWSEPNPVPPWEWRRNESGKGKK